MVASSLPRSFNGYRPMSASQNEYSKVSSDHAEREPRQGEHSASEDDPCSEHMADEVGGLEALLKARRKSSEPRPTQQQDKKEDASPRTSYKRGNTDKTGGNVDKET